jgi:large subunit ribosomal protein L29
MNAKELKEKSKEELLELNRSYQKEIEGTMDDMFKGKEKNVKKVRNLRKDIARVLTVINQKAKEENE